METTYNDMYARMPLSLSQLNVALDKCTKLEDVINIGLYDLCKDSTKNKPITFSRFIEAVRYPLDSFPDRTNAGIIFLAKKVQSFCPKKPTAEDTKSLKNFWAQAKQSQTAQVESESKEDSELTTDGRKVTHAEILATYKTYVESSPKERLEEMLAIPSCASDKDRAQRLQMILNALVQEEMYMRIVVPYVNLQIEIIKLEAKPTDNSQILRLNEFFEMHIFDISDRKLSKEDMSFLLHFRNLFEIRKENGKTLLLLHPVLEDFLASSTLHKKLLEMRVIVKDKMIHAIIDFWMKSYNKTMFRNTAISIGKLFRNNYETIR